MTTFAAAEPAEPNPDPTVSGAEESDAETIADTAGHVRRWRLWRIRLIRRPSPSCCA